MSTLAYALPRPARHRFAAWPVWRDSTTERVQFVAISKKEAARRWHKAPASTVKLTPPASTAA